MESAFFVHFPISWCLKPRWEPSVGVYRPLNPKKESLTSSRFFKKVLPLLYGSVRMVPGKCLWCRWSQFWTLPPAPKGSKQVANLCHFQDPSCHQPLLGTLSISVEKTVGFTVRENRKGFWGRQSEVHGDCDQVLVSERTLVFHEAVHGRKNGFLRISRC